jgi:hypothetical protein
MHSTFTKYAIVSIKRLVKKSRREEVNLVIKYLESSRGYNLLNIFVS